MVAALATTASTPLPTAAHVYNALAEQLRTGGTEAIVYVDRRTYRRNASGRSLRSHSRRLGLETSRTCMVTATTIVEPDVPATYCIMVRVLPETHPGHS